MVPYSIKLSPRAAYFSSSEPAHKKLLHYEISTRNVLSNGRSSCGFLLRPSFIKQGVARWKGNKSKENLGRLSAGPREIILLNSRILGLIRESPINSDHSGGPRTCVKRSLKINPTETDFNWEAQVFGQRGDV